MPNATQQNFIPHESAFTPSHGRERKGLADLLVLIGVVLVVASVALAVGVFLYGEFLKKSTFSKLDQLERAKAAFEPSLIEELTRLDDRMQAAGEVLAAHIAPSAFFKMLEQTTISSIAYSSLEFEMMEAQRMSIQTAGVAGSVNAIALQADLFAKGGMITSPIFSNINRQADGVHFDLSAHINPIAINFTQLLSVPGNFTPAGTLPETNELPQESGGPFGTPSGEEALEL